METRVKIMAVDDRNENLLALEGVLSAEKYELVSLRSGTDALRYLLLEDVDDIAVILMDVQMPGLNGFQTVELIKQRERSRDIPVIFLTAISTSIDHVLRGYHAGSIDYLFKPVHPELLKLKVDAFVKLHQYHKQIREQGDMLHKRTVELEETNRKLAEADMLLKSQNGRLESMVEERTRELLQANEKLRKSEERFRKMFMASPCLISICRLSDHRYIDVNESWKAVSGYGEEAIGMTGNLLQIRYDTEGEGAEIAKRPQRNVKVKYRTKSNEVRNGLLSTEIIDIDEDKCLLQVLIDITEQVQFEKEMSRLAQLNLVGEMAAGIAHEIRNPMTTIRGFLQLFRVEGGRINDEFLDIMLAELDRANGIITEYLSLAKNKQTDLQPRQLNRVIESLQPLLQAEAIMSGKYVHIECGPDVELLLDEKEIRQLILNLSINGLEAMESGGVLKIETALEDSQLVLKIVDQGHGISKTDLEKLGRPFFTTKEHGTGLGLAVCYSIAARHKASIEVQSSSSGTAFIVRFARLETNRKPSSCPVQ